MNDATALTALLERAAAGDDDASRLLFDQIYPTLRKLAHQQLSVNQRPTLCTTDLVHEAYLRLFGVDSASGLRDRGHLFAAVARVMRHVLVDHARRHHAQKRGGGWERVSLDENRLGGDDLPEQVLALENSLGRLKRADPRSHDVVELKFFGGCSIDEIADHLGVSPMTVKRDWRKARAFLYAHMSSGS